MRLPLLCVVCSKLLAAQVSGELALHDASDAGKVSVRWNAQGLVVATHVTRSVPAEAHVELWLTASADPELPPLAWGHQFGEEPGTPENCAKLAQDPSQRDACVAWIESQNAYRAVLPRLFLRRWRLGPGMAEEFYATPAFRSLSEEQQKRLAQLQPETLPRFTADAGKSEYNFEILVPWSAFPPADRLSLDRIGFQVDVRGGGLALTTLSKGLKIGGLPRVALSPPIVTRITRCEYPLTGRTMFGDERPAYYRLNEQFETGSMFILQNDTRGYQYLPSPNALSPGLRVSKLFSQELTPGEFLCGPPVAYRKGSAVKRFPDLELGPGRALISHQVRTRFPVRRLRDGTRLIEFGPDVSYSEFGSGQCGACPVVSFKLFALSPSGEIGQVLGFSKRVAEEEYEIEVSPDWSRITEYFEADDKWRSAAHCLVGHDYKDCGENPEAPAPSGRVVRDALK